MQRIFSAVNCSEPPGKPAGGTWEWDGGRDYLSTATFTCGPYGAFLSPETGQFYTELESVCAWNKSWSPASLDSCAATYCQVRLAPGKNIRRISKYS